jgi:hypothetical protein
MPRLNREGKKKGRGRINLLMVYVTISLLKPKFTNLAWLTSYDFCEIKGSSEMRAIVLD